MRGQLSGMLNGGTMMLDSGTGNTAPEPSTGLP